MIKKTFIALALLFLSQFSTAQTEFQKEYFSHNANDKIKSLTASLDWNLTPTKIEENFYQHSDSDSIAEKPKKKRFFLNIRPGIGISSFAVENAAFTVRNVDFEGLSFRLGLEFEYVLPFHKNKWSAIVEPVYRTFSSDATIENSSLSPDLTYRSLEVHSGIRHYMFLDDEIALFVNAAFVFSFTSDSSTLSYSPVESYNLAGNSNFALGIGYLSENRLSAEVRYQSSRTLIWESDFNSVFVVVGYRLF
jgi:hypothetical protein